MECFQFSDKVNHIQAGIFAELNRKKEELLWKGKRVYNLSIGTPDFQPAPPSITSIPNCARIKAIVPPPPASILPISVIWKATSFSSNSAVVDGLDYAQKYRNLPYIGVVEGVE